MHSLTVAGCAVSVRIITLQVGYGVIGAQNKRPRVTLMVSQNTFLRNLRIMKELCQNLKIFKRRLNQNKSSMITSRK